MPAHQTAHRWVSWDDYHHAIESLVIIVHQSGWQFDQVLCLARGGLRVGDVFSRLFKVPLAILSTSSYREAAGTRRGELDISNSITSTAGPLAGRILLIDDLVDSGVTLQRVQEHLRIHFREVTEVRSAVIWYKACSVMRPDYFVEYLPDNPWIHQPFEIYDDMTPDRL
ncbi:MAG: phosphoribosyltransferase [Betaproteobacteria bacterium]|nr:phosphoribosyltransferase [Betaproteobacteria bacterium]